MPHAKFIIVLFFGIYGMTMIIGEDKDAHVHLKFFEESYVDKDFKTFIGETKNILLLKPGENDGKTNVDPYLHLISFVVAIFTSNSRFLFVVVSLIYGFFYVRGVSKVYELVKGKWNFTLFILFFAFVFWKSLEGINSIRNWTAMWIFFNGAFSYFKTKKIKYVFLVFMAPMVHFAYALIAFPFFIMLIFKNRPVIYGSILLASFAYTAIDATFVNDLMHLTDLGTQKIGYIKEGSSTDYLLERDTESFHAKYYLVAGKLFISTLFYYMLLTYGYFKKKNHTILSQSLASMAILLIALSNLATFSTVVNARVFLNAGLYVLAYLILTYSANLKLGINLKNYVFNSLIFLTLPFLGVFIFTQWSQIGEFTDIRVAVSPLMYPFFGEEAYSLKELLRKLF